MFINKKDTAALSPSEIWFLLSVSGGSAVMLSLILMFYFPATRYIEDFTPLFFLLTSFLITKNLHISRDNIADKAFLALFSLAGLWSIVAGLLLSLPVENVVKIIKLTIQIRNTLLGFGIGN